MGVMETFLAYANEFETTYEDDDWQRLEKFFAADAVYEVKSSTFPCRLVGPSAVFAGIKKSLDGFDRRMDSRRIDVLAPPTVNDDSIEVKWAVTYTLGSAPPVRVEAVSTGRVADGKITHLTDAYATEAEQTLGGWLREHAPDVNPSYT